MKQNQQHPNKNYHVGRNSRPTLGLFLPRIISLHQPQWLGVVDAARQQDANLICFDGEELHSPNGFAAQSNIVFNLVETGNLDGLVIWSAALDFYLSPAEMKAFYRRYQSLPIICVEREVPGLPSLVVDNKQAMFEAVNHLIEVHGYRRIAFIRGPEGHAGAQGRYQGYIEALAQHGLPFDPNLVPPPTHWWATEEATARTNLLLEEQAANVEAIVAANDNMAVGVSLALQARRMHVPGDVAVVGFDDVIHIAGDPEAVETDLGGGVASFRALMLPLTTVRMPFYDLGRRAAELVLAQVRGESMPEVITMPTELMIRRSCGCFLGEVRPTAPEPIVMPQERLIPTGEPLTLAGQGEQLDAQSWPDLVAPAAELEPGWADRLLTAFLSQIQGQSTYAFLLVLDEMLRSSVRPGDSLESWWQALFALRRQTLPYLVTGEDLARAEALWQQIQLFMQGVAERFYSYQQLLAEKRNQILRKMGQKLITTFDIDQLAEIMAQELPDLGIRSCYLALYERQASFSGSSQAKLREEEGHPAEWSRSILVYENRRRVELEADAAIFPSKQLVPGGRLHRERPYSMVVEPLYFQDQQLGFGLFEVGPREGWIYDVLRGQLSSSLQGALLVEREKRALMEVEEAKQKVETALAEALAAQRQTQKLATELATVAEVSTAISTILEVDQLLQRVVDLTKDSFDLYHTHIYLLNQAGNTLVLTAGAGEVGKQMVIQGWHIPIEQEQSLVARAARTQQSVIINDVRSAPDFLPNPLLPETRAEMAVPMIASNNIVGVLDLQAEVVGRFTQEDAHIYTTLAGQIAVALQNARFYREIQMRAEQERLVRMITDRVQRAPDIETILQVSVEQLSRMLGTSQTVVRLGTPAQLLPQSKDVPSQ